MGTSTEWVRYGRPAADSLRRAIAQAKASDPLALVTVIVPSNHVGVAARRLLASGEVGPVCERGTGVAAVTFLTPYRLGELLGAGRLAGQHRRPVSTPVLAAALRAELAENPGLFRPVATHPATETALVGAYRELRDLPPTALTALAWQSPRAADVIRLHRSVRERMRLHWYDEEDLMDAAVEALAADEAGTVELGSVIVYLPERLSRHAASLLAAVEAQRGLTVIAGTVGVAQADADVVQSVQRLTGVLDAPPESDPMAVVDAARTRIVTVSDADEEVRAGLRAVMAAVREGVALDRICILVASPEPYARLAYEQLSAAGVACNGTAIMPLSGRVAGRSLLGLLALAEGGFRRDEVFAWMAGAPILVQGRWVPVAAWERVSREAGVVAGRAQWDELLAHIAERHEERAAGAEADPEAPDWLADRSRETASRALALREFVLALMDDLAEAGTATRSWDTWAEWGRGLLRRLLGGEDRRGRDEWPSPEVRAAERVERALDRLEGLGEIEGPVGLDVFRRTLELELDSGLGRVGRMGEGVLIAPVGMGVGLDLDLVVVVGLAEGVLPAPPCDDSLLPDRERAAAGGELEPRGARVERQHRELLAALAGARAQLLCVPRGDLRGSRERVPSRWVLDVASALDGSDRPWFSEDLLDPARGGSHHWLRHVASFDAGLRAVEIPASDQEYRLRALLAVSKDEARSVDEIYADGASVLAQRRSPRFTRFDGNLAGLTVPSPAGAVTSATRLEAWAGCPFAYLLQHVLSVQTIENPEEELEITPLTLGSLVHQVLEDFIEESLAQAGDCPVGGWTASDEERLLRIGQLVCDEYEARGVTGRPIFWQRDRRRILADLLRTLREDMLYRQGHHTRPIAAELAFGMRGATIPEVAMPLPDGRSVGFRGLADRVDLADDGTVHVVDYKTGSARTYQGLNEGDPVLHGRKLQLPVYGQAARALRGEPDAAVQAHYWFVSSKGKFERIGYRVTADVLTIAGQTLGTIVEGIESGVFTPRPPESSTTPWTECHFCDPDGLGATDLRRAWERKAADPAMATFIGLIDPDVSDDD